VVPILIGKRSAFSPLLVLMSKTRIEKKVAEWLDDKYVRLPLVIELVDGLHEYMKDLAEQASQQAVHWNTGDSSPDYTWEKVEMFHQMISTEQALTVPQPSGLKAAVKVAVYKELELIAVELSNWLGNATEVKMKDTDETKINRTGFQLTLQNLLDDFMKIGSWADEQFKSFRSVSPHHVFMNIYSEEDSSIAIPETSNGILRLNQLITCELIQSPLSKDIL